MSIRVGITFDYNIHLPEREYQVGEEIEHEGKKYRVRNLGNKLVYLEDVIPERKRNAKPARKG